MALQSEDVFSSGIVQFDVGEDVKSFTAHSRLVCESSFVFNKMMTNPMKEALEGRVRLEHIDHDTFVRFVEYMYAGDYNAAEARVVLDKPDVDECPLFAEDSDPCPPRASPERASESPSEPPKKKIKLFEPNKIHRHWLEDLAEFSLPAFDAVDPFPTISKPSPTEIVNLHDYSEVFSHARLYAFAEQYQAENLKWLVLHKLHKSFRRTRFHPALIHEFVDILILSYENTRDSDEKEPMRELLTLFGAWHFKELVACPDFENLARDHGQCIADLCQKVARRL